MLEENKTLIRRYYEAVISKCKLYFSICTYLIIRGTDK